MFDDKAAIERRACLSIADQDVTKSRVVGMGMADLLGATETEFNTDFAILAAKQADLIYSASGSFAGSTVGGVGALCGSKETRVRARAERWSSRPASDPQLQWEDVDELPFVASVGDGALRISGFDSPQDDHALELEGFGVGRVIVMARGRQRVDYGDGEQPAAAEEWLFQFFPEDGPTDPLAGPPRRINGFKPYSRWSARSGWLGALHAWRQTGWHAYLSSSAGFSALVGGLSFAQRAVDARELAEASFGYSRNGSPDPTRFPMDALEIQLREDRDDRLASLFGSPITTVSDSIEALTSIGLLLPIQRHGRTLLVPNPDPGFVWDRTGLTEECIGQLRIEIGYADFRSIAEDINIALWWVGPEGLTTTVREMGIRWSVTAADIRGALGLLGKTTGLTVTPTLTASPIDDDARIHVRTVGRKPLG